MRLNLIAFLLWLQDVIDGLLGRFDVCYLCGEQADAWCAEGCGRRVCPDHFDFAWEDACFCVPCSNAEQVLAACEDGGRKDDALGEGK